MLYDEDFWTEHIVTSEKRTENTKESLRFYLFEHSLSKKKGKNYYPRLFYFAKLNNYFCYFCFKI